MDADIKVLERLYDRFNARDIDGVLVALTEDVAWANGMEGGHVHGHDAVRDYWTRQWAMISPHVEPVGFRRERPAARSSRRSCRPSATSKAGRWRARRTG
jgi:ketosteroid isomerase-like protein